MFIKFFNVQEITNKNLGRGQKNIDEGISYLYIEQFKLNCVHTCILWYWQMSKWLGTSFTSPLNRH